MDADIAIDIHFDKLGGGNRCVCLCRLGPAGLTLSLFPRLVAVVCSTCCCVLLLCVLVRCRVACVSAQSPGDVAGTTPGHAHPGGRGHALSAQHSQSQGHH